MEHGLNIKTDTQEKSTNKYACRFYVMMNGMDYPNIEDYGIIDAESEEEAMSICLDNRWPKWWLYNKDSNLRHVVEFWREHIQIIKVKQ